MSRICLFTDASADPTPGRGGYAVTTHDVPMLMGSETGSTTVTRLEGLAVVAAMRMAHHRFSDKEVHIYTDADLWVKRHHQLPMLYYNGWRRKSGKLVKELDILEAMWMYYAPQRVFIYWVKGHSGDVGNTFADRMAKEARYLTNELFRGMVA